RDAVQQFADAVARGWWRQHALILQEATWSVHPVPVADAVEWEQPRPVVLWRPLQGLGRAMKVLPVEGAQGRTVDQREWRFCRHPQAPFARRIRSRWCRAVIGARKHAAAQRVAACGAVHPCDGVLEIVFRPRREFEEI